MLFIHFEDRQRRLLLHCIRTHISIPSSIPLSPQHRQERRTRIMAAAEPGYRLHKEVHMLRPFQEEGEFSLHPGVAYCYFLIHAFVFIDMNAV